MNDPSELMTTLVAKCVATRRSRLATALQRSRSRILPAGFLEDGRVARFHLELFVQQADYDALDHPDNDQAFLSATAKQWTRLRFASAPRQLVTDVRILPTTESVGPQRRHQPIKTTEQSSIAQVFISHASEDTEFARDLASALKTRGVTTWFDEAEIRTGGSIPSAIREGLARTACGVVILSPAFLDKPYPTHELDVLVLRRASAQCILIPVLHGLAHEDLVERVPDVSILSHLDSTQGVNVLANEIANVIRSRQILLRST